MTSAPGMNYVIVALCMLITALLYFIMNNRDTLCIPYPDDCLYR